MSLHTNCWVVWFWCFFSKILIRYFEKEHKYRFIFVIWFCRWLGPKNHFIFCALILVRLLVIWFHWNFSFYAFSGKSKISVSNFQKCHKYRFIFAISFGNSSSGIQMIIIFCWDVLLNVVDIFDKITLWCFFQKSKILILNFLK